MTDRDPSPSDIRRELAALRRELEIINSHRLVKIYNKPWRLFGFRFVGGLFNGLGTVIGATFLVSVVVYWLQGIEWIPLVGDWASQIAEQIGQEVEQGVEEGMEEGAREAQEPDPAP